ncbi:hypothetical protein D030_1779B, partial [Vibrio parahaemolyticus AQ3810]
TSQCRV